MIFLLLHVKAGHRSMPKLVYPLALAGQSNGMVLTYRYSRITLLLLIATQVAKAILVKTFESRVPDTKPSLLSTVVARGLAIVSGSRYLVHVLVPTIVLVSIIEYRICFNF